MNSGLTVKGPLKHPAKVAVPPPPPLPFLAAVTRPKASTVMFVFVYDPAVTPLVVVFGWQFAFHTEALKGSSETAQTVFAGTLRVAPAAALPK